MNGRIDDGRFDRWSCILGRVSRLPQEPQEKPPSRLTVERIFAAHEFEREDAVGAMAARGTRLHDLEDSKDPSGGRDLVRHDPATGKREVLVPAAHLVPPGEESPLRDPRLCALQGSRAALDLHQLEARLAAEHARRLLGARPREPRAAEAGRRCPALVAHASRSSRRTARGSPTCATNNLYVEDLRDGRITPLTNSQSPDEINGTFDWVYEEEFGLRDGFRWSPDGKSIAYWQLDTQGVREYPLVNNTDSLYPRITPVKYPKVGEKNAACRVGVVPAAGGETCWLTLPGDPRDNYIAFMEWAGNSDRARSCSNSTGSRTPCRVIGGIRRRTLGGTSAARSSTEHDDAWVDLQDELHWIYKDQTTDSSGSASATAGGTSTGSTRAGETPTLITPGDFDVIQIAGIDEKSG